MAIQGHLLGRLRLFILKELFELLGSLIDHSTRRYAPRSNPIKPKSIYFRFIPTIGVYVRGPKVRVSKRNEEYWSISIGLYTLCKTSVRTYVREEQQSRILF